MGTFHVELKKTVDDSYEIEVGRSLADRLAKDLEHGLAGSLRRFALITDSNVERLYAEPVRDRLLAAGFEGEIFSFPAGEKSKTRETKAEIEDRMLEAGYRRDCFVLAVGGGVVSDLAGFLAGTYGRGVPFINYATTLLAAADASVGGKTAVDTPLATNLIGLFNQPKKVYIDIDCWSTLPVREISSGLAETVKHACLADAEFFVYLEEEMENILNGADRPCEHMARRNCEIKYQVVMKDERETGLREVLNLGHTVGRAIETLSGYRLLHGEAVSIGLNAAYSLSVYMGYATEEEAGRVRALLKRAGLPVGIPGYIDREALVRKLYTDKKVRNGRLRFVIPKGIGAVVEFRPGVFAEEVSEETARMIILGMETER
ncbi:MAG: 3-dehydroquinate synthase [Clostridia bacterium]|nr:3-dehydroquinate synthase [Clostridia bacterium]